MTQLVHDNDVFKYGKFTSFNIQRTKFRSNHEENKYMWILIQILSPEAPSYSFTSILFMNERPADGPKIKFGLFTTKHLFQHSCVPQKLISYVDIGKHTHTNRQPTLHTSCKKQLQWDPFLSFQVPPVIIPFQLILSQNVAVLEESISGTQADHTADVWNSKNGEGFQFWTIKIIKLREENLPS